MMYYDNPICARCMSDDVEQMVHVYIPVKGQPDLVVQAVSNAENWYDDYWCPICDREVGVIESPYTPPPPESTWTEATK